MSSGKEDVKGPRIGGLAFRKGIVASRVVAPLFWLERSSSDSESTVPGDSRGEPPQNSTWWIPQPVLGNIVSPVLWGVLDMSSHVLWYTVCPFHSSLIAYAVVSVSISVIATVSPTSLLTVWRGEVSTCTLGMNILFNMLSSSAFLWFLNSQRLGVRVMCAEDSCMRKSSHSLSVNWLVGWWSVA